MTHELAVWFFTNRVGTLGLTNGRLAFRYEPGWLSRSDAVPLSQSLPLQVDMFDDHACRPYFAGLLPESEKRRLVAQRFQVSRQNDLALLDGIGGECAGAVTFLPTGEVLPERGATDAVRWLDEAELSRLLAELPFRPLLTGEEGIRLSLAMKP